MRTVIGITGTTSVGKSAVAVKLAQMLHSCVISADSMQIYRGLDIGTAKIKPAEMMGIKHYMIDIVNPDVNYSSFLYQQDASQIIQTLNCTPIIAGGTGFYFDSLLYPPEFEECSAETKQQIAAMYKRDGLQPLVDKLKQLDIDTYNAIDLKNPQRVIRALEIAYSGTNKSCGLGRKTPQYNMILFVLQRNREDLYKQIELRVDNMIAEGLVDEVQKIISYYGICDTTAYKAIGYKEIIEYLQGNLSLSEASDLIKLNTRHYAKRQITYYKKMSVAQYIDVDGLHTDEIANKIYTYLHEKQAI